MSLLTIIQSAAPRVGLSKPTVGTASADPKVLQLIEMVNEDGQELGARHAWQALTTESNFTTLNTEIQGTIQALAGADFSFIVNETMWNRSQRRPVFGPRSDAQWQQLKAQFTAGPWIQYRIRGNNVLFLPAPAAGQAVYFEWVTKNWATDSTGATGKSSMSSDGDIAKLDERLLTLGAIWRFKAANRLDYAEDFRKCEDAIADAITRDAGKPILNLGGEPSYFYPGILVPAGSWTQS